MANRIEDTYRRCFRSLGHRGWGVLHLSCWSWSDAGLQGSLAGLWRGAVYLYGRRNLVTLERSSLMKERGNISLDSCTVYLK